MLKWVAESMFTSQIPFWPLGKSLTDLTAHSADFKHEVQFSHHKEYGLAWENHWIMSSVAI